MPSPPRKDETKQQFISRCHSYMEKHKEGKPGQASAICYSMWRNRNKMKKDSADNAIQDRVFDFKFDAQPSTMRIDETTGFLHCRGVFTRSGVFDYYDDNLNLIRELRPEEEVFDGESIKSLQLAPITNLHPEELVTTENVNELLVGVVGEDIKREGDYLAGSMTLMDKDTIETILARKEEGLSSELSGGYTCNVVLEKGTHHKDGDYDAKQSAIRYNHLSIVPKGRAGRNVRIMDQDGNLDKNGKRKEDKMPNLVKFIRKATKLDGFNVDEISCEIPEENLVSFEAMANKLDEAAEVITSLKKDNDELQAKNDQDKEEINKLMKQVASIKDPNSVEIQAIVRSYKTVYDAAEKLQVKTDGKKLDDIKVECIKAVSENFDAEGKSVDYINARFDAINEIVEMKQKMDDDAATGQLNKDSKDNKDKKDDKELSPKEKFLLQDAENRKVK
jgi:hypothetical protein